MRAYWTSTGRAPYSKHRKLIIWWRQHNELGTGAIGLRIAHRDDQMFSDRYVWRRIRLGEWFIVFVGWRRKDA